jgi:hypothetical protein
VMLLYLALMPGGTLLLLHSIETPAER